MAGNGLGPCPPRCAGLVLVPPDGCGERGMMLCYECGEEMFLDDHEVSYHGSPGAVDYDRDGDHVALSEDAAEASFIDPPKDL